MRTDNAKGVHEQLLEVIWDMVYLDKTSNINEVIEDLVSYLSVKKATRILHIYLTGAVESQSWS